MNDTPETDKLISDWYCNLTNWPNFIEIARKFERERGEANTKLQDVSSKLADALRERDEARAHWGTESMNAAQFFGEKTKAIAERDEAIKLLKYSSTYSNTKSHQEDTYKFLSKINK